MLEALEALRGDALQPRIEQAVRLSAHVGSTPAELRQIANVSEHLVSEATAALLAEQRLYKYVESGVSRFIHRDPFHELLGRATTSLAAYHERYAHRAGIPREELRSQIRSDLPPRYFNELLSALVEAGQVEIAGTYLRATGFTPTLTDELKALSDKLLARYRRAGLEPPSPADMRQELVAAGCDGTDVDEVTELLIADGRLQRVIERLIFASEHIARVEEQVAAFLREHGEMTTPQLKEITGTSRKFTVPLGEHLDARKLTIRVGDVRKLR